MANGNESYDVGGDGDSHSLALPSGSSATSAPICVGLDNRTLRVFARNGGSPFATLRVDVLFEDAAGSVHSLTVGNVGSTSSWQPSVQMPVVANLLPLLPGQYTPVEFRFTPGGGSGRSTTSTSIRITAARPHSRQTRPRDSASPPLGRPIRYKGR